MVSRIVDQAQFAIHSVGSVEAADIVRYVLVVVVLAVTYHVLVVERRSDGPPLVKGWIPFVGVGLTYVSNPERFLMKCKQRYGDIFTLYMGGKRFHVISDPVNGVPTVYRNSKAFSFTALTNHVDIVVFGLSKEFAAHAPLYKACQQILVPYLLAQEMVDALIQEFNVNLAYILTREIQKLNVDDQLSTDGIVVGLDAWVKRVMFETSGRTLFGETWPVDEEFFNDYIAWDNGIYSMLKGYPSIMMRKAISGRERYYERLVKVFEKGLINPSRLITERIKVRHPRTW
jgi:Cytochrome P450